MSLMPTNVHNCKNEIIHQQINNECSVRNISWVDEEETKSNTFNVNENFLFLKHFFQH